MKDIMKIFKFEVLKEIKNRSFIISTIVLALVIIGISLFMRFMITSDMKEEEEKSNTVGVLSHSISDEEINQIYDDYKKYTSEDEIKTAIENEEIEYGIVFNSLDDVKIIVNRASPDIVFGSYVEAIKDYILNQELAKSDLSTEKIDLMYEEITVNQEIEAMQDTNIMAVGGAFIAIILIYIMVLGSGQTVAASITAEKADRTMEILLTSTSADSLIHGKVFASLLTSLMQLVVMGIASIIGFIINMDIFLQDLNPEMASQVEGADMESMMNMAGNMNLAFSPDILVFTLIFFITGYFLYVYIYAALGASVSKTEDLAMAVMPITMVTLVIYFASLMALPNPDGTIMTVLSYIPFSSVFVAVIRYALTDMSLVELAISYLILLVTTIIFVKLSVKLYRMSSLNYGNTSTKSQLKALFTKD